MGGWLTGLFVPLLSLSRRGIFLLTIYHKHISTISRHSLWGPGARKRSKPNRGHTKQRKRERERQTAKGKINIESYSLWLPCDISLLKHKIKINNKTRPAEKRNEFIRKISETKTHKHINCVSPTHTHRIFCRALDTHWGRHDCCQQFANKTVRLRTGQQIWLY